eukprot:CAMPEP_0170441158 /NCGR_PEP_ID=MMETSP0117_2-20130122/46738_1 /TAXON_ID=400756 /ORGANISM="Durinskia baltica, Strain CSIRO CS-38" /LENGTH=30 /DNA_ID= /DNA_START= /DNA_END= /DNA_ORIENTATION=
MGTSTSFAIAFCIVVGGVAAFERAFASAAA